MNHTKIAKSYVEVERQNLKEIDDPHLIILKLFDSLINAMNNFVESSKTNEKMEFRSEQFSRSLSILYSLQSSLDFEKGGEIANNLFTLYEFTRQKLIQDFKEKSFTGTVKACEQLGGIREAWVQIGKKNAKTE